MLLSVISETPVIRASLWSGVQAALDGRSYVSATGRATSLHQTDREHAPEAIAKPAPAGVPVETFQSGT